MANNHTAGHLKEAPRGKVGAGRVFRTIVLDILMTGLILCVFALFHHVIPRWGYKSTRGREAVQTVTVPAPTPADNTVTVQETAPADGAVPDTTPEPTPEPTPDPRTEWQIKFADKFTEEIVQTETTYSSPDISIEITTQAGYINGYYSTWHVADIYIARIENFQTYVAFNGWERFSDDDAVKLDLESGAILSVNGDFCTTQSRGFMVRNGVTYMTAQTANDICVLYYDGSIETFGANEYLVEDVQAKNPYQVWKFGPELLDDDGLPLSEYNASWAIRAENPRTGLGYYEPGHYCFVVVDGRITGYSRGVKIDEFAQIFADLGCKAAYNMDGGASAVMTFNDALYNRQSSYRKVGDTLIIKEIEPAQVPETTEGTEP